VYAALAHPDTRTGDLGGQADTAGYADAAIRAMGGSGPASRGARVHGRPIGQGRVSAQEVTGLR
jgi:hypothetical protein